MPRSLPYRAAAALLALLTCFATPALAVAHGATHAHVAAEHALAPESESEPVITSGQEHDDESGQEQEYDLEHTYEHEYEHEHAHAQPHSADTGAGASVLEAAHVPRLQSPEHAHEHGHAAVQSANVTRDGIRFEHRAQGAVIAEPLILRAGARFVLVADAGWRDRSLLARPGPDSGPPPNPRAPPVR